jgi:hypothetical protein
VLGGFGAAAGTWLAWQTASAIPSDQQLRSLNAALTGIPAEAPLYHETSAQRGPSDLLLTDGTAKWSASRIRDTLTGAGWRITSFRERDVRHPLSEVTDASVPMKSGVWTATSGGLKMQASGQVINGSPFTDAASYNIRVWPAEPALLRPLTIAGTVAGLLAGWLLAATLARRRLATALAAVGLAAATLPAYSFYREAYEVMVYPHGSPYPMTVEGSHGGTLTFICTVAGLLAIVAAAIVARPRPAVRAG